MTNPNYQVYNQVSRDAQVALEEFKSDFETAYIVANQDLWSRSSGLNIVTKNLKVSLPVPLTSAGYEKAHGDRRFRSLSERSFSMIPETWEDGVAELAKVVEAPDFIGWAQQPAAMAAAAAQLPDELVTTLLESNPLSWEAQDVGGTLFFGTHQFNILKAAAGTFSNDVTVGDTTLTPANVGIARQMFRSIKGPNGKPLGVRFKNLLVPGVLEEAARRVSQQGTTPQAGPSVGGTQTFSQVDNIYKGTPYQVGDTLTSATYWYAIGEKLGMQPWTLCDHGAPETLLFDKTSHLYQTQRKIGIASSFETTAALGFSQVVIRFKGTSS